MRRFTLLGIGLLMTAAACEHAAKPATSSVPSASGPVAAADLVMAVQPSAPKPVPTAAGKALARAYSDSLRVMAVLARADTAVECEAFSEGDLNGDGRPDYLLLARTKYPDGEVSENSYGRKVFIVLNAGAAGLRVAAVNENLVGCTDCGGAGVGDPFQSFEAYDLGFTVTQLYGACDKTQMVSAFAYDTVRHDWLLKTRDESNYSCNDTTATVHETHESPRNFGHVRFANASP